MTTSDTIKEIRKEFPALEQSVHGKPLAYLDNAATSLKPRSVILAIQQYYERDSANVHRGLHSLSQRASSSFETAREKVRSFIHAKNIEDIVFVRGTTEAINLVAHSFVIPRLSKGDEILITQLEHHANIVPWQIAAKKTGAKITVVPITEQGDILLSEVEKRIHNKTKFISISHISNTLGTILPVEQIVQCAKKYNIPILIDGAQAAPHTPIDVQKLGCDFYCFSGHKVYGPTGIGVLYGQKEVLSEMEPYQSGGGMIQEVSFDQSTFLDSPLRFEAGTPHIAGAIGLGAAVDFVQSLPQKQIEKHEQELTQYAKTELNKLDQINMVANPSKQAPVFSFVSDNMHPQDIGTLLDMEGVAIRTGHHCTQPLLKKFGLHATARASFAFYNTFEEVDQLIHALKVAQSIFGEN